MIDDLAKTVVEKEIQQGRISKEEIDLYVYGYILLIETSIRITLSFCIGLLFSSLAEVILFSALFIPLRSFGGGVHAERAWQCILLSTGVMILYCLALRLEYREEIYWSILFLTVVSTRTSFSNIRKCHYGRVLTNNLIIYVICAIAVSCSLMCAVGYNYHLAEAFVVPVFTWMISSICDNKAAIFCTGKMRTTEKEDASMKG